MAGGDYSGHQIPDAPGPRARSYPDGASGLPGRGGLQVLARLQSVDGVAVLCSRYERSRPALVMPFRLDLLVPPFPRELGDPDERVSVELEDGRQDGQLPTLPLPDDVQPPHLPGHVERDADHPVGG